MWSVSVYYVCSILYTVYGAIAYNFTIYCTYSSYNAHCCNQNQNILLSSTLTTTAVYQSGFNAFVFDKVSCTPRQECEWKNTVNLDCCAWKDSSANYGRHVAVRGSHKNRESQQMWRKYFFATHDVFSIRGPRLKTHSSTIRNYFFRKFLSRVVDCEEINQYIASNTSLWHNCWRMC